jgi:hypothetical protein
MDVHSAPHPERRESMFNKSAALVVVVVLLTALPLSAQAVQARVTIPVEETQITTHPCTGEAVLVTFSGFIAIHAVFNDNVATGQTEVVLHGAGTAMSSRLEFISEGSGPNLVAEARSHITINADGTVTVSTTEMTSTCRA